MFRHILIAHDLSHEADLALQRAAQLARQHQARLTLLHVLDYPDLRQSAQQFLERKLQAHALADSQVQVVGGAATEQIAQHVVLEQADLLVVGAHHQGRPERFAGTTLERLARQCRVPLLLAVGDSPAPYRQALVGLDFSLAACTALQLVHRLLPSDARLTALHICEVAPLQASTTDYEPALFEQLLRDEQAKLPAGGPTLEARLLRGERLSRLEQALADPPVQLLALGQHNRSQLSEALLGGLTQQLLRQPPCDLLISRSPS
ncbi:universal stress protein [Pseudomonas sp. UL073]|uniref:Universal stress protein n=1 Tax=Zestomonas insulae TaxID=2809017 RepID=A0ABS2IDV8_9GAMM|nr:universal stress protein [Pseudomonas insulae]MBM7061157.1 universal stress protein [Pseudomonas insulae]